MADLEYTVTPDIDVFMKAADQAAARTALALGMTNTPTFEDIVLTHKPDTYVTPEQFGYPTGNRTANTAAINSAIQTGKPVLLAPQVYEIDGELSMNLDGGVILGSQMYQGTVLQTTATSGDVIAITGAKQRVANLRITAPSGGANTVRGIYLSSTAFHIHLHDLQIGNCHTGIRNEGWWQLFEKILIPTTHGVCFSCASANSSLFQIQGDTNAAVEAKHYDIQGALKSDFWLSIDGDIYNPSTVSNCKGGTMSLYTEIRRDPGSSYDTTAWIFGFAGPNFGVDINVMTSMKNWNTLQPGIIMDRNRGCKLRNTYGSADGSTSGNSYYAVETTPGCIDTEIHIAQLGEVSGFNRILPQSERGILRTPDLLPVDTLTIDSATDSTCVVETDWADLPVDFEVADVPTMLATHADATFMTKVRTLDTGDIYVLYKNLAGRTGEGAEWLNWVKWTEMLPTDRRIWKIKAVGSSVDGSFYVRFNDNPFYPYGPAETYPIELPGKNICWCAWMYCDSTWYDQASKGPNYYCYFRRVVGAEQAQTGNQKRQLNNWFLAIGDYDMSFPTGTPPDSPADTDFVSTEFNVYGSQTGGYVDGQTMWFTDPMVFWSDSITGADRAMKIARQIQNG